MRRLLPLTALAVLAGCNSEPSITATNSSVSDVQNQVAAAGGSMDMRAGRWEGTITVKDATPAGAGNPAAGAGRTSSQPIRACVTADQMKPGANPFAAQLQAGCIYDRFDLKGGRVDATMTCRQQGVTLKSSMNGEFTADTYRVDTVAEASGPAAGPLSGIKSESTIDVKRTGDCRGDEDRLG